MHCYVQYSAEYHILRRTVQVHALQYCVCVNIFCIFILNRFNFEKKEKFLISHGLLYLEIVFSLELVLVVDPARCQQLGAATSLSLRRLTIYILAQLNISYYRFVF